MLRCGNGQIGATWKLARMYAEAIMLPATTMKPSLTAKSPNRMSRVRLRKAISDALVGAGGYIRRGIPGTIGPAGRDRCAGIFHARSQLPGEPECPVRNGQDVSMARVAERPAQGRPASGRSFVAEKARRRAGNARKSAVSQRQGFAVRALMTVAFERAQLRGWIRNMVKRPSPWRRRQ